MAKIRWTLKCLNLTFSINFIFSGGSLNSPLTSNCYPFWHRKEHFIIFCPLFISNFSMCDIISPPNRLYTSSNIAGLSYLFICLLCLIRSTDKLCDVDNQMGRSQIVNVAGEDNKGYFIHNKTGKEVLNWKT